MSYYKNTLSSIFNTVDIFQTSRLPTQKFPRFKLSMVQSFKCIKTKQLGKKLMFTLESGIESEFLVRRRLLAIALLNDYTSLPNDRYHQYFQAISIVANKIG